MDDVEVIIGGVAPSVSFSANGCTEDEKILGDTAMDHIHATTKITTTSGDVNAYARSIVPHRATGVIESPLILARVDVVGTVRGSKIRDDVLDDGRGIITVGGDRGLGELVELSGVEDVPTVLRIRSG